MKKHIKESLLGYRKQIDILDGELLVSLKKRFIIVKEIGKIKKLYKLPIKDNTRVKYLIEHMTRLARKYGIPIGLVKKIFKEIINFAMIEEKKRI